MICYVVLSGSGVLFMVFGLCVGRCLSKGFAEVVFLCVLWVRLGFACWLL